MLLLSILCFVSSTVALQFELLARNSSRSSGITRIVLTESQLTDYIAIEVFQLREKKWYTGGRRQKGDELKYDLHCNENIDREYYGVKLIFPEQTEFYITQVEVFVEQESDVSRAYIKKGGIGYSFMTLVIQAQYTKYWYYHIYVYGHNYT